MLIEISLTIIGAILVLSKIVRRIKIKDVGTQTEPGLWLPQVAMWLDDSSMSESSGESVLSDLEMKVIKEYCPTERENLKKS
jgi:hypothetical protein